MYVVASDNLWYGSGQRQFVWSWENRWGKGFGNILDIPGILTTKHLVLNFDYFEDDEVFQEIALEELKIALEKLSSLVSLEIDATWLIKFEAGLFDRLQHLKKLVIGESAFEYIRQGAFSGLESLETLLIYSNALRRIEEGAFAGLNNLEKLVIRSDSLECIEKSSFQGLNKLRQLDIYADSLAALGPGVFNGLARLQELSCYNFYELAPGVLRDLPSDVKICTDKYVDY